MYNIEKHNTNWTYWTEAQISGQRDLVIVKVLDAHQYFRYLI